jgi:hypothetical protein
MNPTTAVLSAQNSQSMRATLRAGLACGVLDIMAALVVYGRFFHPVCRARRVR